MKKGTEGDMEGDIEGCADGGMEVLRIRRGSYVDVEGVLKGGREVQRGGGREAVIQTSTNISVCLLTLNDATSSMNSTMTRVL